LFFFLFFVRVVRISQWWCQWWSAQLLSITAYVAAVCEDCR
jgi:hypothetical protein